MIHTTHLCLYRQLELHDRSHYVEAITDLSKVVKFDSKDGKAFYYRSAVDRQED